jgi:hypothetical protein
LAREGPGDLNFAIAIRHSRTCNPVSYGDGKIDEAVPKAILGAFWVGWLD